MFTICNNTGGAMDNDLKILNLPEGKMKQLNNAGISNITDVLFCFPKRYYDLRVPVNTNNATWGRRCAIKLHMQDISKDSRGRYVKCVCVDKSTQATVYIYWFNLNVNYIYGIYYKYKGMDIIIDGIPNRDEKGTIKIVNPNNLTDDISSITKVVPEYSKIPGMSNSYFLNVIDKCLDLCDVDDPIPEDIRKRFDLISQNRMIFNYHKAQNIEDLTLAKKKEIFNCIYEYALQLEEDTRGLYVKSSYNPKFLTKCNQLIRELPYTLTEDQQNVITQFVHKAQQGNRVNALIQGDVGCGKTVCAFLLMTAMADNGYQSALMAPTSVLAKQHYEELLNMTNHLGFNTVYLGGNMKAAEKRKALAMIMDGSANFIVGTHSLISDNVEYFNLGLTIVDEEHKFGVVQRENLKGKAAQGVHNISMSATPIPRSLALAVYGGAMDIYNITTMPGGRKPILTEVVNNENSAYRFIYTQLKAGRQCYIVCPHVVKKTKESNMGECTTVEEEFVRVDSFFSKYGYKTGVLTGKMKESEKDETIQAFKDNKIQLLVATTIVEVGVNTPNATVIMIRDAERYGLAQLHQLRGRVGRGSLQSYCMLMSTDAINPRLSVMCKTTNGFEIAEEDLKIRGTGELTGVRQSGIDYKFAYILKYPKLFAKIQEIIKGDNSKDVE